MSLPPVDDWDATVYHRVSKPHIGWGNEVLNRLTLRGDEVVVDAGCGSGLVTAALAARLPHGRVIGVDVSAAMLDQAAQELASEIAAGRVRLVRSDLLQLKEAVAEPVDVVFSTATFHWIDDHAGLFQQVYECLKPGGRLAAQFGGAGNIETVIRHGNAVGSRPPYAEYLGALNAWHHRAGADETARRLRSAGFHDVHVWIAPSPQEFVSRETFETFLWKVVLGRQRALLPSALQPLYVRDLVDEYERHEGATYVLDYMRLNVEAVRPAP